MYARSMSDSWSAYRRRRNAFLLSWLGGAVVVAFFAFVAEQLLGRSAREISVALLAICWFAMFVAAAIRLQRYRCPRCGHPFFLRMWSPWWPFARHCVHCHLTKWTQPSQTI